MEGLSNLARASYAPKGPTVLLVEHQAGVARRIESSLARFGYDLPATATSPAEAIEAVDTFRPDLVLIDVRLESGDDGIAAAAEIRARHSTPIVFLTSYSDDATLMRAQSQAQPHGYVHEPYRDLELRAAVEAALQRHGLEQAISQQRSLLAGVLSGMSDAVAAADADGNVVLVNDAGRMAFGESVAPPRIPSPSSAPPIYQTDEEVVCPPEELPLARALGGEIVRDVELFIRSTEQPEGRWYSVNAAPLLDPSGAVCGAVTVGRDITELRAERSELQQLSETDALTGTYNRRGFMHVARSALESARESGRQPAVFFLDLNGMKRINDSLGHPEGDRLLMDVTWILRACFRASDIIGRIGGDEFVVLAPDGGNHAEVMRERLRAAVDQFNESSQREYRISVSIGLRKCDPGEPTALEDLVEQADQRMYEDKLVRGSLRAAALPEGDHIARAGTTARVMARTPILPGPIEADPTRRASSVPPPPAASPAAVHAPIAFIPPPKPPSLWPKIAAAPKTLLLVDDEPRNLVLLERLVAPLGHEIIRAEDGASAIEAFEQHRPDLVLLDLVMPGLDGFDVLSYIRAQGRDHVPVVVLTAHSEREIRLRGLEAGADDFLEKPADGRTLRVRVTTLLQLKESRDALRRINAELESRNEALERLQREQRELTAFVVHDLKNPLAALWANVEFARSKLGAERTELTDALDDASQAARRLRSMIDDLLTISRLEQSDLPVHGELIVLWDLLREVFTEYVRRAADKNVELLAMERTSARVHADRALLQRVIENILDNSIRYTPENGRVSIATRHNGEVVISVSNTGPSIPPSERIRIFEKFARIERGGGHGNAGLGLYFCKRVLEAFGGRIEVTETPEWPTSFVLRLPARTSEIR
jgi:two-component system, sensor histidine kinase and response regulator